MSSRRRSRISDEEDDKGLIWKLPSLNTKQLGKLGPAFGLGAGCGFGFGIGLLGGAGIGPGIPGLQVGFGVGAGCGIGVGFGYGMGKGVAYDETRKYSNVSNLFSGNRALPSQEDIGAIMEDLLTTTKKLIQATSREVDKWRR